MRQLNQKGQLTTEFMFAIVLAFGLFSIFFAMSYTFSVIEVSQYIVYSTARTHAASNLDKETQRQEAIKKFKSLHDSAAFNSLYSGNWFAFGPLAENMFRQGESETYSAELSREGGNEYSKVFVGISVPFEAKILSTVKIPFISDGGDTDGTFRTNINTMMIREISQNECQTLHWGEGRKKALSGLKSGTQFYQQSKYFNMEDNGC